VNLVRIIDASIQPVASVRDLGIQLNCDVSMATRVHLVLCGAPADL
jgi:hypothetical protein